MSRRVGIVLNLIFSLTLTMSAWASGHEFTLPPEIAAELQSLQTALDKERFSLYVLKMAERAQKWDEKIAEDLAVLAYSTELHQFSEKDIQDPFRYDQALYGWLKARHPHFKIPFKEFAWNWNFYKNSLTESFLIGAGANSAKGADAEIQPMTRETFAVPEFVGDRGHTLNIRRYISERHTLSAFDFALKKGLDIYIGTYREFLREIERQGSRIVGEITPKARNYNKIFIIYTAQKKLRVAVTGVSGSSRLEHYVAIMSWLQKQRRRSSKDVQVFGDPREHLKEQVRTLASQLSVLPQADLVFIGQKAFWEKALTAIERVSALKTLQEVAPDAFDKALDETQRKRLKSLFAAFTQGRPFDCAEFASQLHDMAERLAPVFRKHDIILRDSIREINVNNPSHDFSDILVRTAEGLKRWRFFSNVWGDEIRAMAQAVRETSDAPVIYIGTAGALPDKGLAVGDLLIAEKVITVDGRKLAVPAPQTLIPEGKTGLTVGAVNTPVAETVDWFNEQKEHIDAVEIEASHLVEGFGREKNRLNIYLIASDVIGSELTLDAADSNHRKKTLLDLANAIGHDQGVDFFRFGAPEKTPVPSTVEQRIEDELAKRDHLSRFQLRQRLKEKPPKTIAQLEVFLRDNRSFSNEFIEKRLQELEGHLSALRIFMEDEGLSPRFYLSESFFEGRYNPKTDKFSVYLRVSTLEAQRRLKNILQHLTEERPSFQRVLDIQLDRGPPGSGWILADLESLSHRTGLTQLYREIALTQGGLIPADSRSSDLRFVQSSDRPCPSPEKCHLAFFKPNPKTEELLQEFAAGRAPEASLRKAIAEMNREAKLNSIYEIELRLVDSLPRGDLAVIEPDLSDEKTPLIVLKITRQGLRQPMVVLEEMIHLQQITNSENELHKKWRTMNVFMHPFHWLEVMENAKLGSPTALLKLARAELEAIQAAEMSSHSMRSMFGGGVAADSLKNYFDARRAHAEEIYFAAAATHRQWLREANARFEKQKSSWENLEQAEKKLNDLIAANDRKGVGRLLRFYLPWPLMEPLEKRAWEKWLHAIEHPSSTDRELIFRGMYDDTVNVNEDKDPFLMSTVLTRNQGSYTRRLRSLRTMRERFGATLLRGDESEQPYRLGGPNPVTVSALMHNHSIEAKGSPFLSASNLDVAFKFGPRQIGAFWLERKRRVLNALPLARYNYQEERLIPLIVFPDEIIAFHDYKEDDRGISIVKPEERKKDFLTIVEAALRRKVTEQEKSGSKDEKKFLREAFQEWRELLLGESLPKLSDKSSPKVIGGSLPKATRCDVLLSRKSRREASSFNH